MSHYKKTLKMVSDKSFNKKFKDISTEEKIILLAIARAADEQGNQECKAALDDQELYEATNKEALIYCETLTTNLLRYCSGKKPTKEDIHSYLSGVCQAIKSVSPIDIINFLEHTTDEAKKMPLKKLRALFASVKIQTSELSIN